MRNIYRRELIRCFADEPFSSSPEFENRSYLREDNYIDLVVLPSSQTQQELTNSDRDALINYLNKVSSQQTHCIDIAEVLQRNDEIVFVQGVAGAGKTTMVDMMTFKWAKKELAGDAFENIDFIFKFTCREMNNLNCKDLTWEHLLKTTYPEIFDDLDGYNELLQGLKDISGRVLILVDGLDELSNVYQMNSSGNDKLLEIVFKLMSPKQNTFLKDHKTIISGRPKACELARRQFSKILKTKTVQVCGFNQTNIVKYIKNFFGNDDNYKSNKVQFLINQSKNLKMMASVPVFLWVICSVFSEDYIDKPVKSNGELYFYACLVLLRNHFHRKTSKSLHLHEIVNDESVIKQLYSVMILSVKTYMQNKVLFTDNEIQDLPYSLEQTGFIVKYPRGNKGKPTYQFRHLIIQEFLCAMYLTITKDIGKYTSNRELSSCLPTIVDIHRLIENKENQLFVEFYHGLDHVKEPISRFYQWYKAYKFNSFIKSYNVDLKNNTFTIPENAIKGTQLILNKDLLKKMTMVDDLLIVSSKRIKSVRIFGDYDKIPLLVDTRIFQIILTVVYSLNIQIIDKCLVYFLEDVSPNNFIIDNVLKFILVPIHFIILFEPAGSLLCCDSECQLTVSPDGVMSKADFISKLFDLLGKFKDRISRFVIYIDYMVSQEEDMKLMGSVILEAIEIGELHKGNTAIDVLFGSFARDDEKNAEMKLEAKLYYEQFLDERGKLTELVNFQ